MVFEILKRWNTRRQFRRVLRSRTSKLFSDAWCRWREDERNQTAMTLQTIEQLCSILADTLGWPSLLFFPLDDYQVVMFADDDFGSIAALAEMIALLHDVPLRRAFDLVPEDLCPSSTVGELFRKLGSIKESIEGVRSAL